MAHRLQVLHHQVPGAAEAHEPPTQVAQVTANLAHFVSNLVDEHRQTRLDARQRIADTKAPKLLLTHPPLPIGHHPLAVQVLGLWCGAP